jgi:NAD(P)-dependent dehydrogenase (short-subunit alcohol dehydrogenase family)
MQDKPVAMVTGANKGIGLQIAKDLAAHGLTVLVGSRNLEHGEAAAKSIGADARALQLDVTNRASIAAAAQRIRRELEVLGGSASVGDPLRFSTGAYFTLKIVSGDSRRPRETVFCSS